MTARLAFVLGCAISVTGCLSSSTVIRVKTDGSGTIEQTLMFSAENMENALAAMGLKPTESKTVRTSGPIEPADLEKDIGRFGNGMKLMSMTPVKAAGGFEGVSVKFAFEDITQLRTDDFLTPGPVGDEKKKGGETARDRVGFTMARGPNGTAILTATFAETPAPSSGPKSTAKAPKDGPDMDDPAVREMLNAMFKGFRIGMDIEIVGQIVRTNADYVEGTRITLAEVNVEQLLRESKQLESLEKVLTPDTSIAKLRPHLKDIKGLKINHAVVTVEFK